MLKHRSVLIIYPVLLSFVGFLSIERAVFWLVNLWMPGAWIGQTAAFLLAFAAAVYMYRGLVREDGLPLSPCPLPVVGLHLGYGTGWLIGIMYVVLCIFPVEGEAAMENLPARLLISVGIHPVLEEILFRRIYFRRLLLLTVPEKTDGYASGQEENSLPYRNGYEKKLPLSETLFAILMQAILFALAHSGDGEMLYGFAGGVVLGIVMLRTGRLWIPIVCHMFVNLRSVTYGYLPPQLCVVLDISLTAFGLICGLVFWIVRIRSSKREKGEVL